MNIPPCPRWTNTKLDVLEEGPHALTLDGFYRQYAETYQMAGEEALEGMQGLQLIIDELHNCCESNPQACPTTPSLSQQAAHASTVCHQIIKQLMETVIPLMQEMKARTFPVVHETDQALRAEQQAISHPARTGM